MPEQAVQYMQIVFRGTTPCSIGMLTASDLSLASGELGNMRARMLREREIFPA